MEGIDLQNYVAPSQSLNRMLDIHRWLGIMRLVMEIKTIEELDKAISDGPYTQLGLYPKFFITTDGGVLSFDSVKKHIELIREAISDKADVGGWRVCGCDVNWESVLYCDHSGKQIESAYEPIEEND
jgi:hypothetical protein